MAAPTVQVSSRAGGRVDGLQLQRLAREARPDLPVIVVTGRRDLTEDAIAAMQGNRGFFRKPFNGADLLAAVNKALLAPVAPRRAK
jgi:FixJ family two-component response regulator